VRQRCIWPLVTKSHWGPSCFPHHWTPESCLENPAAKPRLGRPLTTSHFDIAMRAVLATFSWFAVVTVCCREASCSRSFLCGCTPIHPFVNTPARKQSLRPSGPDTEDAFRPSRGRKGRLIQTYARLTGPSPRICSGWPRAARIFPPGGQEIDATTTSPPFIPSMFARRSPFRLRCCFQLSTHAAFF
jgi:hypothetical protein